MTRFSKVKGDAPWTTKPNQTDPSGQPNPYSQWLSSPDPGLVANALICLIHQANYLLDRQVAGLEKQFIHDGGYSERLATERIAERQRQKEVKRTDRSNQSDRSDPSDRSDRSDPTDPSDKHSAPDCPNCGKPMALRTARKGPNAGAQFWGCSAYPECKGIRNLDRPM